MNKKIVVVICSYLLFFVSCHERDVVARKQAEEKAKVNKITDVVDGTDGGTAAGAGDGDSDGDSDSDSVSDGSPAGSNDPSITNPVINASGKVPATPPHNPAPAARVHDDTSFVFEVGDMIKLESVEKKNGFTILLNVIRNGKVEKTIQAAFKAVEQEVKLGEIDVNGAKWALSLNRTKNYNSAFTAEVFLGGNPIRGQEFSLSGFNTIIIVKDDIELSRT